MQDYYDVLGVPRTASQKEIRAAFRKLARRYHPDVKPGDKAAEARFKAINEAHEVLSDPEKRRRYDSGEMAWPASAPWERPRAQRQSDSVQFHGVSEADLDSIFGGGSPFADILGGAFSRGGARRRARGSDLETEAEISLEEAFSGTTRTIEVTDERGPRRIEVAIPAGIADGARVRAAGQGGGGGGGGDSGDLFVRVRIRHHHVFERDGQDLRARVAVPLEVALLGGTVEVPTLRGRSILTVPAETQNGARLRMRGLGMPAVNQQSAGDLIAVIEVHLPLPLTDRLRAWAAQLPTIRG